MPWAFLLAKHTCKIVQVGVGIATCQLYHKAALQEKMKTHALGMEFACSALFVKEQQKRPFKRMVKIEGTNRNRNENDQIWSPVNVKPQNFSFANVRYTSLLQQM